MIRLSGEGGVMIRSVRGAKGVLGSHVTLFKRMTVETSKPEIITGRH